MTHSLGSSFESRVPLLANVVCMSECVDTNTVFTVEPHAPSFWQLSDWALVAVKLPYGSAGTTLTNDSWDCTTVNESMATSCFGFFSTRLAASNNSAAGQRSEQSLLSSGASWNQLLKLKSTQLWMKYFICDETVTPQKRTHNIQVSMLPCVFLQAATFWMQLVWENVRTCLKVNVVESTEVLGPVLGTGLLLRQLQVPLTLFSILQVSTSSYESLSSFSGTVQRGAKAVSAANAKRFIYFSGWISSPEDDVSGVILAQSCN